MRCLCSLKFIIPIISDGFRVRDMLMTAAKAFCCISESKKSNSKKSDKRGFLDARPYSSISCLASTNNYLFLSRVCANDANMIEA